MFSSRSFWTSSSLDVPAGVTQEEGHIGFLIHLLSSVRALIFLARRIRPFLSLVDREVEFCVLTIQSFSFRWAFDFLFFIFLMRKIPFTGIELTSQRVKRLRGHLWATGATGSLKVHPTIIDLDLVLTVFLKKNLNASQAERFSGLELEKVIWSGFNVRHE